MTLAVSNKAKIVAMKLSLISLLCGCWLIGLANATAKESRCGSVDIRNSPRMAFQPRQASANLLKYKECTILEGDFTISMITQTNVTNEEYPVFENLREITGSILVFQIRGLLSLGRMFPNLRVIGGHSLIMNYALVVYQNNDLREIGLTKLTAIKNGGVRITENPRLCFSRSINWDIILMGKIRDLIIDQVAGQCNNECNVKDESNCYKDGNTGNLPYCWNPSHCQKFCKNVKYPGSGCTEDEAEPCHQFCMGGCTRPDDPSTCFSCRKLDVNGTCVDECPDDMYEQLGRRCLNRADCHSIPAVTANPGTNDKLEWKAFKKQCNYDCPNGYQEDPENPHNCIECKGYCPKKCAGDTVDSIGSAMKFSKCNAIEGNLELDMRIGMDSASAEKFTEAFGEIEEISGYLLIRFSSAFMSLHMFKKLRVIHGQQLWKNMYSLVVFENQNLHQLFNLENRKMQILKGKVSFQNNRMLCYKKIEAFLDYVGLKENVTENDVSPFSNGDKAICDEIPLEVKIVSVSNYGFVVSWSPFNTTDMDHRKFLGYQIFYKKIDKIDPNMTIDDDRSACSDSWNMQFVTEGGDIDLNGEVIPEESNPSNQMRGEFITTGVEANALYAVYVQTRLVNHPGAKNAISKIHFVKTVFGPPDPPRMRESRPLGPDSIKIMWDPPLNEYGVITHYSISWNLVTDQSITQFSIAHGESVDACNRRRAPVASKNSHMSSSVALKNSKSPDTCSKEEGCCKCTVGNSQDYNFNSLPDMPKSAEASRGEREKVESAIFEDAMQNKVFVQKDLPPPIIMDTSNSTNSTTGLSVRKKRRTLRSTIQGLTENDESASFSSTDEPKVIYHNMDQLNVLADGGDVDGTYNVSYGKINITGTHLILTGLPHFSEYHISIYACQDTSAPDNYCSPRPLWTSVRTEAIPEYDVIEPESVVVLNATEENDNDKRIFWSPPRTPNGFVLAYRAKLIRDDGGASADWSTEQCVSKKDFEANNGIVFAGLTDGSYTLEVRVETSTFLYNNATVIPKIFELYTPGFFTPWTVACLVAAAIILITIVGLITYYFVHRLFGKKLEEKFMQTISANPEYLSQMDIYKADEWELKRDDLVLEMEIGRGTFGKVLRGYGKNISSHNGEVFGECAVKTVPETANNAERLHFLIEASVMKQFNTAFIVKLYGVVSDGQPVLVVMELMEKGNLRDFLRCHRPNAEENKDNRPIPTLMQYFTWAAQIADGMSYLESMKFCHRDLAARNCMVHADESVKIGDFGMARDIYYHEYYKPAGKRLMPVRWMAPESLKDGKFTMKSDIWSFGIVMYEMLTLGQQPYAGLGNDQVFNFIGVQRHVLRKPTECPTFWYKLMRTCWRYDPRERPSFHHIVKHLQDFTTDHFKGVSYVLNNLQNWSEQDQYYDFDIDLSGESNDQGNVYNEEFAYNQEEEEEEEVDPEEDGDLSNSENNSKDGYESEEELAMPSALNNNRRPNETTTSDAEGLLTDLRVTGGGGTPRRQLKAEQNLVENTF